MEGERVNVECVGGYPDVVSELSGSQDGYDIDLYPSERFPGLSTSGDRDRNDADELLSPEEMIGEPYNLEPDFKAYCVTCGFVVRQQGHQERCKVPISTVEVELQRKRAWFGDIMQTCHVRWLLIHAQVPMKDLQILSVQFVGSKGQVSWYNTYCGAKLRSHGTSDHSVATAFEASYYLIRQFRCDYLKYAVAQLGCHVEENQFQALLNLCQNEFAFQELKLCGRDKLVPQL